MHLCLEEELNMPFRRHLISASDLVTSYEAIRAGFVSLALEKNRRATPFLQQARILRKEAQTVDDPRRLIELNGIRASLLVAAGVSDKALNHLTEADKSLSIENLIETFLRPAGKSFVEELVYRFLLTKGDALGGSTHLSPFAPQNSDFCVYLRCKSCVVSGTFSENGCGADLLS